MILNRFPEWTQDLWAMRSDAVISESLLASSTIPLGKPGCDNRIAHVLWSHGFVIKNPCHWLVTLHHHAQQERAYDERKDRLYGSACYVYPSLGLSGASELQHVIWSKSGQSVVGALVNHVGDSLIPKQLHSSMLLESASFTNQLKDAAMAAEYRIYNHQHANHRRQMLTASHLIAHGLQYTSGDGSSICGLQVRSGSSALNNYRLIVRSMPDNIERCIILAKGKREFISLAEAEAPATAVCIHVAPANVSTSSDDKSDTELVEFTIYEKAHNRGNQKDKARSQKGPRNDSAYTSLNLPSPRHVATAGLDLSQWERLHNYNERFSIWQRHEKIMCLDRFWPTAAVYNKAPAQVEAMETEAREMFLWAFTWPVLEWKPGQISECKRYSGDQMFWQHPCRTEQDAFASHCRLVRPIRHDNTVHVYLGLPWATWIDRKHNPRTFLYSVQRRLQAITKVLSIWGLTLRVHTVCQHIKWREWQHFFLDTGITDLWVSHKHRGELSEHNIRLESWPLYAVNILEPKRRVGLRTIAINERSILASFKGAYMPHYISKTRQQIRALDRLDGFIIEVNDEWHFNPIVYGYQVMNNELQDTPERAQAIIDYNRLLVNSVFSLCPSGAGANTLRLWESLGSGSIPVVLSDQFEPPHIISKEGGAIDWEEAVIFHKEAQWDSLPQRLAGISSEERLLRQRNCLRLFERSRLKTCFGNENELTRQGSVV
jgi:Exostosin family